MFRTFFYITLFLIFTTKTANSQVNLVYNGDFEIYDTCPPNYSQPGGFDYVRYCLGWYSAMYFTTPDYLNECGSSNTIGVPINGMGYQEAKSGVGYCGLIAYGIEPAYGRNWWEYIQTRLMIPLKNGTQYKVSFYVSLAERSSWAVKHLGIYISSDSLYRSGWDWYPFNVSPQIQADFFITDTMNWVMISGIYTATGNEKFLTIGHFADTFGNSAQTGPVIPRQSGPL
ncbi:MAG: hypothetical protein WCL06_08800, partial [Bacteroidota bacterium]